MVAIRNAAVEGFLKKPDPAIHTVLLFGADAGLVRERAAVLLKASVDDPSDAFAMVRLDGDDIAADPARLADEALTVPLFGGRRAIRVVAGSRSFASSVEALVGETLRDCRIVIEAGELKADAPLRKACERGAHSAAIACYADQQADLARLIDSELGAAGMTLSRDARETLAASLGGDRQASRNEIRKLALYAHGRSEVTLADVEAVISDVSGLRVDPILDGAFAGQPAVVEDLFAKAMASGTHPAQILLSAQRHAAALHRASLRMTEGGVDAALASFPRLHFSRKDSIGRALRQTSPARFATIVTAFGAAALEVRRSPMLAADITQRALMAVAVNARRRS